MGNSYVEMDDAWWFGTAIFLPFSWEHKNPNWRSLIYFSEWGGEKTPSRSCLWSEMTHWRIEYEYYSFSFIMPLNDALNDSLSFMTMCNNHSGDVEGWLVWMVKTEPWFSTVLPLHSIWWFFPYHFPWWSLVATSRAESGVFFHPDP